MGIHATYSARWSQDGDLICVMMEILSALLLLQFFLVQYFIFTAI